MGQIRYTDFQTLPEDTISATAGANISGATIGSVDALDINNSAGTYTMTQAQHEQLATVSNTTNAQTFVLTSAGTITARNGIENYHLADAGGSIFTQSATTTPVTVKSGAGDDLIITNAVDANRDALTIDLTSGGNDTVRILNDSGIVTPFTNVVQFGQLTDGQTLAINGDTYTASGTVSGATVAAYFANKTFGTTHTSGAVSTDTVTFTSVYTGSTSTYIDITGTGSVLSNTATQGGLVSTDFGGFGGTDTSTGVDYNDGTLLATADDWSISNNSQGSITYVDIYGFTAVETHESRDTIQLDRFTGSVAPEVTTTSTDLRAFASGSVFEITSSLYTVSGSAFGNLGSIATMLDTINNVNDGEYYIIVYNGNDTNADAALYYARATEGDGFDFADSNGATGGYDTDSLELLAVFHDVGANTLNSQNFADVL